MRFKGVGRALIAGGVVCVIIYIVTALYGLSATALRIGNVLFYIGIVAMIVGLALRLSRPVTRI